MTSLDFSRELEAAAIAHFRKQDVSLLQYRGVNRLREFM